MNKQQLLDQFRNLMKNSSDINYDQAIEDCENLVKQLTYIEEPMLDKGYENGPGVIPWRKYDPTDRSIPSHVDHIVTNGRNTLIAQHASIPGTGKYGWRINNALIPWVTHWSPINKPGEEEA